MNGKDGFQAVSTIKYIDRHSITNQQLSPPPAFPNANDQNFTICQRTILAFSFQPSAIRNLCPYSWHVIQL